VARIPSQPEVFGDYEADFFGALFFAVVFSAAVFFAAPPTVFFAAGAFLAAAVFLAVAVASRACRHPADSFSSGEKNSAASLPLHAAHRCQDDARTSRVPPSGSRVG
jgi:hypothetical protein